ncbi:MAG: ABC transporter permease [Blastocatellia bacterium]
METLFQDIRYGIRVLLKGRAVTAIAVLALTLGIGANTAIFSVINAVLIKPLPYPQPDRIVRIHEKSAQFDQMSISYPNFLDWQKQNQLFEAMSVFRYQGFNVTGAQGPERLQGRIISASFFSVLGVQPVIGRGILPEEDRPGGAPAAVISYALWQRRFGGDQSLLGKPIIINGKDHTIVGIMPAGFRFYSQADLFVPIGVQDDAIWHARELHPGLQAIGRLKPGVTLEQADSEIVGIASALEKQYPDTNKGYSAGLVSMYEDMVGSIRPALLVLLGAVGFVLLIACANVANLLLARAASRQKEIAIRTALGASRTRLVRQLLTESLLLAIAGGGLGLLLAMWGTDALVAAIPDTLPRAEDIGLDNSVLVFTLAVSLVTGVVFGLVPALQASRLDLNESLKEGGRTSASTRQGVRSALVVAEVALALVLLIGAGLMIRSIFRLNQIAPGINPKNVLTMEIPLSLSTYDEPSKIRNFYRQLIERLESVPGVEAAAVNADMPLTGSDSEVPFWIGGGPRPAPDDMQWSLFYPTSAGYARAMGLPLMKGRFISEQDTQNSPTVVVIDEYLARGLFPNADPIGKRLTIQGVGGIPDIACEIVGIVGHVKHFGLGTDAQQKIQYQLYFPYSQIPDIFLAPMVEGMTVVARTSSDPTGLINEAKSQVLAVDKDQPVNNIKTMEQIIAASISQQRFSMLLLGIFAVVALVLAAVGIYGVMSYTVTQRTHEIGIRMALGARPGDVLKLVVRQGMTLAIAGVGIGLGAAFALTRLMESLLYGVSATDPLTFAAISIVLAGVALGACFIPARRATKVDPMIALRYE